MRCYDGLAAQGATLTLFAALPGVAGEVAPADLLGAGDARIDLSAHVAAGGGGMLSYSATVDDQRLATVSVEGAMLTGAANEDGEEGVAVVTVTATDGPDGDAALRGGNLAECAGTLERLAFHHRVASGWVVVPATTHSRLLPRSLALAKGARLWAG